MIDLDLARLISVRAEKGGFFSVLPAAKPSVGAGLSIALLGFIAILAWYIVA